jgi:hypothetical protein
VQYYFEYVKLQTPQPEAAEQSKVNSGKPQSKPFINYLHHSDKEALIQKLHELLDKEKCKTVAITIKSLIDLSYLAGYDSKNKLYDTVRNEFNFSGTNSGLNKFLNSNATSLTEKDINPTKDILQTIK